MSTDNVVRVTENQRHGQILAWFCPACRHCHSVHTAGSPRWDWNGNRVRPTLSPSVLHYFVDDDGSRKTLCHYFIRDGRIEFCSDSPHAFAGQSVALEPIPEGW